jgi:signal transduction histidine kinase
MTEHSKPAAMDPFASALVEALRTLSHDLRNRLNAVRLSLSVYRLSPEDRKQETLAFVDESLAQLVAAVADVSALAQALEPPAEGRL